MTSKFGGEPVEAPETGGSKFGGELVERPSRSIAKRPGDPSFPQQMYGMAYGAGTELMGAIQHWPNAKFHSNRTLSVLFRL